MYGVPTGVRAAHLGGACTASPALPIISNTANSILWLNSQYVMQDSWYLVPVSGAGTLTDPRQPKYADRFDSYSSYPLDQQDEFIVRFYGETTAHTQTQNESDVSTKSLDWVTDRLNDAFGVEYTPAQWENKLFA